MAAARPSTWLITGASSGFGKSLALQALNAGYKVIGTTRDVSKAQISCPDFSAKGGIWMCLDPAQKNAFDQFAKCSQEHNVDVLVNNAGYAFIGGVEDTRSVSFFAAFHCAKSCVLIHVCSEDEVRDQMEINFYGPLRAVRACLPAMRVKGSGNIVLISSGAG
jgi:NAD(P)-dependent dehydrogenase (short-subunit alcohol dehydrogenase family)